ncbi:acyl-CoA dehydrogenase family protein [Mycolicibacterium holsaticum]|uniref:acyl-CoA dehydrogenase family protein n=1 Tax=Mycolicibacterium holsaticum TaxID=152142 RepID=UPI0022EC41DF|nr:acyl-CoA dehydrogenase family protein [Mycolicibacterium holsaticum]
MAPTAPFVWSVEQEQLRTTLREFLDRESSPLRVFEHIETGFDPKIWTMLCEQIGLTAILIPEHYGGMGGTQTDLAVVLEAAGAALLCAPYFSTVVLGTNALLLSGDDAACADYLPAIAAGRTVVTLGCDADARRVTATATQVDGAWRISGGRLVALDVMEADLLLVFATHDGTTSLFAFDATAPGLQRQQLLTFDLTRRVGSIELRDVPARLVGEPGSGRALLARLIDLAACAQAAEQVGGAARCLADAVDYTKQRFQFGRPIAGFQAVKHTCADLFIDIEFGRSAAEYAAWAAQECSEELPQAAASARIWCSRMFIRVAEETLQLYGGLGVTWEHHAHLYLRRAKAAAQQLSGSGYHRAVLADFLARGGS